MIRSMRKLSAFPFLFVLLATCQPALAQFGGGGMGGHQRGGMDRRGGKLEVAPEETTRHPGDDAIGQLNRLHETLIVTPAQEPLWQAYEKQVLALRQDLLKPRTVSQASSMQQIDQQVDTARNRLAALEDIAEAAHKLYGVLRPEQRTIADQSLAGTLPPMYAGENPFSRPPGDDPGSNRGRRQRRDEN